MTDDHAKKAKTKEQQMLEALAHALRPIIQAGLARLDDKDNAHVSYLLANAKASIRIVVESNSEFRVRGDLVMGPELVAKGVTAPANLFILKSRPKRLH